jgi:hypothetical protein
VQHQCNVTALPADLASAYLVTFGYLAAVTQHLEFSTGILILPQRQTALVNSPLPRFLTKSRFSTDRPRVLVLAPTCAERAFGHVKFGGRPSGYFHDCQ